MCRLQLAGGCGTRVAEKSVSLYSVGLRLKGSLVNCHCQKSDIFFEKLLKAAVFLYSCSYSCTHHLNSASSTIRRFVSFTIKPRDEIAALLLACIFSISKGWRYEISRLSAFRALIANVLSY